MKAKHKNNNKKWKHCSVESTFISNFNEQTESLRRLQSQALRNHSTEFFGAGTGIYFEGLQKTENWSDSHHKN